MLRLRQALNAKTVKVHYDKESGEWKYSEGLIDHTTRLKAVDLTLRLHEAYPADKVEHSGTLTMLAPERIRKPDNSGTSNE